MENQFKNKQKKTTYQNANVVRGPKPPHPNCTMTKDELKEMSQILPTSKIRNRFVYEAYFLGRNPNKLMKIFLSHPEIASMLDDMELTGCAPRIPAKFRVRNCKKPENRGPPKDNRGQGPPRGPPGKADPPTNQFFRQQCQRLISNMSNMEATGIMPLEMSGLGVDEMDNEGLVHDQEQFDGRQPRQGQDNINLSESDPLMGSIANLPGVDGPLKHQYERLISNVNKIGGFRNVNMNYPAQNHEDLSGSGPSAQKRKNFHTQHTVPKKGRFQERSGPASMQQGADNNPHPRNLNPSRRPPFSEESNMLAQMHPRSGQHQEVHGNMPRFSNEFHGNMQPFNDRPQGNMPPFNDSHQGNMPPFYDGPQELSFNSEFHGDMAHFNNGPRGNMGMSNNRSQGNKMPTFSNGPQGNMPNFNNGPPGHMPPFRNGPQSNMPPFNNNGSHGKMRPFNEQQNNMQPFNEPQNNMQPLDNTPIGNMQPFNSEPHRDWPPLGQSHSNMIPDFPQRDQPNIPSFRGGDLDIRPGPSRENPSHPSSHQSMEERPLSNSRRPTPRDDVSRLEGDPRAPMFIVPTRYPSEHFSEKQMDAIENAILDAILEIEDERLKPTFQDSFRSNGRYGVICNDQLSKNWLFGYLSKCRPWPYASFRIISAQPTKIKADALLPLCKNDDNEKILKFIAKQNTKLNVGQWEVVQRLDSASNTTMNLAIDEESANVLKGCRTINFKMGRAEIVVARQNVSGKVDELIATAIQKKNDLDLRMSGRSHLDQTGAHSNRLMPSNQKPRSKEELLERGRDPALEWSETALSSREVVQLPPPPPPRAIRDAMKRLGSSEFGGGSEYEPSRSDRFFRTPSPEPRSMPDSKDHSRQDRGQTAQLYQIPKSGNPMDRDPHHSGSIQIAREQPLQRSSMKIHRITTIDGNSRRDRPMRGNPPSNNQCSSLPPPSRSSHMNFTSRQ